MIYKVILFAVFIYVVYLLFFRKKRVQESDKHSHEEVLMVECAKCKTYIGAEEAIKKDGRYFCSKECLKK